MTDRDTLYRLNEEYVRASLASDVAWYDARLAPDFVCIDSDGSLLDKPAFLSRTAAGSDLADYRLAEVDVRFFGDVALVKALGVWTSKAGMPGTSRYIDVYVRSDGDWKVVSAQITRPARVG
jgi:ketosteroid isomerase-like protein